jgi:hypothetical protein
MFPPGNAFSADAVRGWFERVSLIDDRLERAGIQELTSSDRNENLCMYPLYIVKASARRIFA